MSLLIAIDVNYRALVSDDLDEVQKLFGVDSRLILEAAIKHWEQLEVLDPDTIELIAEDISEACACSNHAAQLEVGRILFNAAANVRSKLDFFLSPMMSRFYETDRLRLVDVLRNDTALVEMR